MPWRKQDAEGGCYEETKKNTPRVTFPILKIVRILNFFVQFDLKKIKIIWEYTQQSISWQFEPKGQETVGQGQEADRKETINKNYL